MTATWFSPMATIFMSNLLLADRHRKHCLDVVDHSKLGLESWPFGRSLMKPHETLNENTLPSFSLDCGFCCVHVRYAPNHHAQPGRFH
jgi:hypothetical protein